MRRRFMPAFLLVGLLFGEEIVIKEIRVKGNWYTKDRVILRLSPIKVGDKIPAHKIDKVLEEARRTLLNTNYFFDVLVYPLHSASSQQVVIMIEVTEGFLWRFGGGPYYVMIGKDNVGGDAIAILSAAGINLQKIAIQKRFLFSSFGIGLCGFHRVSSFEDEEVQRWDICLEGFYEFNPYLQLGISPGYYYGLYEQKSYRWLKLGAHLKMARLDDNFYPKMGYKILASADLNKDYQSLSGSMDHYFSLPFDLIGNLKLEAGSIMGTAPRYGLFDVYGVSRIKALDFSRHIGEEFWLASYSLRKKLFTAPLLFFVGFMDIRAFVDIGRLRGWDGLGRDAGLGLGLHLPSPVFVHINLDGALGRQDKRLYFTITSQL